MTPDQLAHSTQMGFRYSTIIVNYKVARFDFEKTCAHFADWHKITFPASHIVWHEGTKCAEQLIYRMCTFWNDDKNNTIGMGAVLGQKGLSAAQYQSICEKEMDLLLQPSSHTEDNVAIQLIQAQQQIQQLQEQINAFEAEKQQYLLSSKKIYETLLEGCSAHQEYINATARECDTKAKKLYPILENRVNLNIMDMRLHDIEHNWQQRADGTCVIVDSYDNPLTWSNGQYPVYTSNGQFLHCQNRAVKEPADRTVMSVQKRDAKQHMPEWLNKANNNVSAGLQDFEDLLTSWSKGQKLDERGHAIVDHSQDLML